MQSQRPPRAPVVVTLSAEIDLTSQDRAYDQLYAAFASGADIVIADFTATTFCDCSRSHRREWQEGDPMLTRNQVDRQFAAQALKAEAAAPLRPAAEARS